MKEFILLFYFSLHLLVHYEQERGMLQEGVRGVWNNSNPRWQAE
jgi:hypothetical protein